ncbi:unnamed protein product [Adineta steineri]|uniref:Uncharacterized protein n=1 Tax=Adineta steineri TaxID=433720 RepID=A0A819IGL2_9BILA|nr:unnamed protein product [Adineta steineri]
MLFSLACNLNIQCRTFNYDSFSRVCFLFEGSLDTGHVTAAAPTSRIGSLNYLPMFFNAFNQSCSQCTETRYLICSNNTCQCPLHLFWNGSQCENQRYENASCLNNDWCRNDPFGLICSVSNVCIISSAQATILSTSTSTTSTTTTTSPVSMIARCNMTHMTQATYSTGTSPTGLSVVDVNSDNKPDIIVTNNGNSNVGVFLNKGNGTFTTQTTYATGANPQAVAVIDVNSDNKPDIIVANYGSNSVGVLLNAGSGTFTTQTICSTGSKPVSLAVVDVNNDAKPDIIVANSNSNTVGVLLAF